VLINKEERGLLNYHDKNTENKDACN